MHTHTHTREKKEQDLTSSCGAWRARSTRAASHEEVPETVKQSRACDFPRTHVDGEEEEEKTKKQKTLEEKRERRWCKSWRGKGS